MKPPRFSSMRLERLEDRCVPAYNPAVNYPVGSASSDVVVGDFNGDGKADLVSVNDLQVNVLRGNGDGTFAVAQPVTPGPILRYAGVGDLNGDGKLDLAITSSVFDGTTTTGAVLVLLNSTAVPGGPVSFQPVRSFSTGTNLTPDTVAVVDLNGDGRLDVVAAQGGGGNVSVLRGDGAGNLGPARHFAVGANPSLAVGDLDDDGKLDVVTANRGSSGLSVLRNAGNDAAGDVLFQPATNLPVYNVPQSVAVGDFNDDGLMDLAATSVYWGTWCGDYGCYYWTDSYVNVLLGRGDGTFDPIPLGTLVSHYGGSHITTVSDLAVSDFNGDGNRDVVVADALWGGLIALRGAGNGWFQTLYRYDGSGPGSVVMGNFNNDTYPDVAVANIFTPDVSVFVNDTDWRTLTVSGLPATATAGQTHTFTVTVRNNAGNVDTNYTGTMHFTSNDSQASLPADYQFTAADAGVHTFTVTFETAGYQWVYAQDTAAPNLNGFQDITISPAAASAFIVSGLDSPVTIGDGANFTVTAYDAYGNVATNYAGTVHFTSSDSQATLPSDYTFTPNYDYGTGYFSAGFQTVGTRSITVTDLANPGLTATLSGIRVVPRATISGAQAGLRNQTLTFTLGADSGLPASTVFTYTIDWNGDGTGDQTVTGPNGTAVTHTYADSGWYGIGVSATVHIGAEDYTSYTTFQYLPIFAVTVAVQPDPGDATRSALVVQGTADSDSLSLYKGAANAIDLWISGYSIGSYSALGGAAFAHLLVYGNGGNDSIYLGNNMTVPALLFGGEGYDTLDASGSLANNVLVGGADGDGLYGGSGRDLLIGGLGADGLQAASGDDILIGDSTTYDANLTALLAIMKEWGRTDADYLTRVKHLDGRLSGGLNGTYRLTSATVQADNASDNLTGGAGLDWYIVGGKGKKKDKVFGQTSGEVISNF